MKGSPIATNKQCRLCCCLAILATTASCAHVARTESFQFVEQAADSRLKVRVHWQAGGEEDRSVEEAISALLAQELTADYAVQIALLNNRSLQAQYERLGITQADVVQAGLLRNPVFAASVRIPDIAPTGANVGLDVVGDFLHVLMLPTRKRLAVEESRRVQLEVAQAVLDLAAETKIAFLRCQADLRRMRVLLDVAEAADVSATFARELHAAGNLSELELAKHQVEAEDVRLEVALAEAENYASREHLTRLMGLWGRATEYRVVDVLPELPEAEFGLDHLESLAVERRLDLEALHQELLARGYEQDIVQAWRWLGSVELGVGAEREADRQWKTGPGVSLELPVFDQRQADIARADSERRQAEHEFYALAVNIRSEARQARFRLIAARNRALRFRDTVLPLRRQITEKTQEEYNFMLTGAFDLLEAKGNELRAMLNLIDAVRDYWIARVELEHVIGDRLPPDARVHQRPAEPKAATNDVDEPHRHEGGGP